MTYLTLPLFDEQKQSQDGIAICDKVRTLYDSIACRSTFNSNNMK